MTTRQLYYLVTIADTGSLSKAARNLKISQPALSKFLAEYEDSLGFHLFLRYKRQLTPTAVGRYVISCAQKILDEQTRMLQSIRALTSDYARIRLATAPNRGAIIYSRIYNEFSRRYPDVALTLTELYASEQPGAVLHGQIDLALGAGAVSDKVTDLPFAQEELMVSLPVSHPLASLERINLASLKDTPFVLQGERHSIRLIAEELFEHAGFSPVVTFESNDVILVDSMLHQAVGAGLVSQAHVFPCNELVYRHLDPPIYQTLHIRYPLGHKLSEPERYLAGLLIRERLSDPRYQATNCPEAAELMELTETTDSNDTGKPVSDQDSGQETKRRASSRPSAPPVNLSTPLLKYIIAIVDEKSLSKAAEKFYLSQPALSRYLKNAEDMVCARLFTRVHNRLQPTNAGKVFVNFARNILQIDSEMAAHIKTYREGHGGGLYLHCDHDLASRVRTLAAPAFLKLQPDVRLYHV
ncbi:MAG: LysR family transcriptional regulator [Eubacteriales bacterium]|nr:LysR family transcriptional regulator [Eubacteriales bacterium]